MMQIIFLRITYLIPHRFFLPFLSLFFLSPLFCKPVWTKKEGKGSVMWIFS